ncbi:MAG: Inositol 2-dehydrogenase/D-chiro-inositol 3-dehydrogenase [Phycisphaerae bacterium]|nr:Inositol 2-dehydrogenase/D-chiro-inositol 3-dehydrogenase [Phycisphaerae bacterium]
MAKRKQLNVALIGAGFMGRAHSNAHLKVNRFFNLPADVVMHTIVDVAEPAARAAADTWGWRRVVTDIREALADPAIDLVDICLPNYLHAQAAVAAAKAGKAVLCEKPLAHTLADARRMLAAVKQAAVPNFVSFNYRRVPALALARQFIAEGRLGTIYHIRASYLQDWIIDPDFPLVWRLKKELTGSGAHGDLNAHIIDLARFLVGDFDSVSGLMETFIKERPLEVGRQVRGLEGKGGRKKGKVTVDDATLFLARFKNGAVGSFEATRFAQGRKNRNQLEINGSKGSLAFCFERMNELEFMDATQPLAEQGFRTILATEGVHPYMQAWWPPGHIVGYEHTFVNQLADVVRALCSRSKKDRFRPDFADAFEVQKVLEAVGRSARSGRWVKVDSVK